MVKCPRCSKSISGKITNEWDYSVFHVKRFECEKCGQPFRAYFRNDKFSHTIPKSVKS